MGRREEEEQEVPGGLGAEVDLEELVRTGGRGTAAGGEADQMIFICMRMYKCKFLLNAASPTQLI